MIKRNKNKIDSESDKYVDNIRDVYTNKNLLSSSAGRNGTLYDGIPYEIIPGKVRDTCLDNSEYSVDLKKFLGGGSYGMAFKGVLWESDTPITVAIKLYMDESDTEENIYNSVSGLFPNQVSKFYKGAKCKIFNNTKIKIPNSQFLRIIIMEEGTPLDEYLDTIVSDYTKFFDVIEKTAINCAAFNRGGFLHNDIKPGNCIISNDPVRANLGGLLIDFGMTTLNKLKGLPPLDALYFLLTTFESTNKIQNNQRYVERFKQLCKPYYDAIRDTGIQRYQLDTQNRDINVDPITKRFTHGKYDPKGLCAYDIAFALRILCPVATHRNPIVNPPRYNLPAAKQPAAYHPFNIYPAPRLPANQPVQPRYAPANKPVQPRYAPANQPFQPRYVEKPFRF